MRLSALDISEDALLMVSRWQRQAEERKPMYTNRVYVRNLQQWSKGWSDYVFVHNSNNTIVGTLTDGVFCTLRPARSSVYVIGQGSKGDRAATVCALRLMRRSGRPCHPKLP